MKTLVALGLAALSLTWGVLGLRTGRVRSPDGLYWERARKPLIFWSVIVAHLVVGAGILVVIGQQWLAGR